MRSAMSPVSVKPTSRLSKRLALNQIRPRSKSMPPAKLTCSLSSGASSAGMLTRSTPMMTSAGTGMSRMTPISSEISVGVPQPSLPIGADDEVALGEREDRLDVAGDPVDVGDDVLREEDRVDRAGPHADHQRRRVERAVEAEQAADADQREAEAELDRRELGGDQDQEARSRRGRPGTWC